MTDLEFISLNEVVDLTGLKEADIICLERDKRFPKRLSDEANVICYLKEEIDMWIREALSDQVNYILGRY